jgi:hypothetical protein
MFKIFVGLTRKENTDIDVHWKSAGFFWKSKKAWKWVFGI